MSVIMYVSKNEGQTMKLTFLIRTLEFLATDTGSRIMNAAAYFILLVGLVYTVIHLVKMMREPEDRVCAYQEAIKEPERLIS